MRNEDQNFAENEPVSQLLGSLHRVEAPNDFDFRVKARIANGRPSATRSWMPAIVKVAVPAGLLMVVGGYFGFNTFYPVQQGQPTTMSMAGMNPAPIEPVVQKPAQTEISTNTPPPQEERADVRPPDTTGKTDAARSTKLVTNTGSSKRESGGGSYEESVVPPHVISAVSLPQIGVITGNSGSAMTVGSVRPGSVAERSGVKAGDVIEKIGTKSLRVLRDGKSMTIELKP